MDSDIKVKVELTNQQVAYVLEILNRAIQGREAAKLVVPIMDTIEQQTLDQVQEIALSRKEAEKKLSEVQPKVEE